MKIARRKIISFSLCVVMLAAILGLTACSIRGNKNSAGEQDEIAIALSEGLDSEILFYENRKEYKECNTYNFRMDSDHLDEAGDEIQKLYASFENLLENETFADQKIDVDIWYDHYDHDTESLLAEFCNGSNPSNGVNDPHDYVDYVYIRGITEDADFYDENAEYEFNQQSFWEFTSDAADRSFAEDVK